MQNKRQSNWLRAYWYGKDGINYLKKVVAVDPNYYDAYFGLGLYHYYADVIPQFVKMVTAILGIEGDRERGLKELRLAAENGKYSKAQAMLILGNIYLYTEKQSENKVRKGVLALANYKIGSCFATFADRMAERDGKYV